MNKLKRFGLAMDEGLLKKLDHIVEKHGYVNRSEAIRDFVREQLVEDEWQDPEKIVVGTLTLVYNHHASMLSDKLADIQHDFHDHVLVSTHIHLDAHNCAEVIIIKGKSVIVKKIADRLVATKGVKHGKLVMTSTGKELE